MTRIPRVARRGKASRLGGHRGAKLRHIGAAERHEAGRPELLRQIGRYRPCHVTQRPEAERRRLTRDRTAQILVQDRHAAERAIGQVAVSLQPRRIEPRPDHSVQLRVDRLNPGDGRLCQLLGTHLTAADKFSLCGGIQPRGLGHAANATRVRHTARYRCRTSPGTLACAWRADCRPELAPESQPDDSAATGKECDLDAGQARPALREAPGGRLHALLRPFPSWPPLTSGGKAAPAQIRQSGALAGVAAAERQGCHIGSARSP